MIFLVVCHHRIVYDTFITEYENHNMSGHVLVIQDSFAMAYGMRSRIITRQEEVLKCQ